MEVGSDFRENDIGVSDQNMDEDSIVDTSHPESSTTGGSSLLASSSQEEENSNDTAILSPVRQYTVRRISNDEALQQLPVDNGRLRDVRILSLTNILIATCAYVLMRDYYRTPTPKRSHNSANDAISNRAWRMIQSRLCSIIYLAKLPIDANISLDNLADVLMENTGYSYLRSPQPFHVAKDMLIKVAKILYTASELVVNNNKLSTEYRHEVVFNASIIAMSSDSMKLDQISSECPEIGLFMDLANQNPPTTHNSLRYTVAMLVGAAVFFISLAATIRLLCRKLFPRRSRR